MDGSDLVDNEARERFNGDWHRMRMGAATPSAEKAEVTIEAAAREPALTGWWFSGRVEELSEAAAACLNSFELRSRARAARSAHLECAIRLQSEHCTALARVIRAIDPGRNLWDEPRIEFIEQTLVFRSSTRTVAKEKGITH